MFSLPVSFCKSPMQQSHTPALSDLGRPAWHPSKLQRTGRKPRPNRVIHGWCPELLPMPSKHGCVCVQQGGGEVLLLFGDLFHHHRKLHNLG